MLNTIYIESLFDIYTYTLALQSDKHPFRFITGPNGYGKTTILNVLNAIYTGNMEALAAISFKRVQLKFDDGYELTVSQQRANAKEEASDEKVFSNIHLRFAFKKSNEEANLYTIDWDSNKDNGEESDLATKGLSLYFYSHPIYYIRDGRIWTPDGEPAVTKYAEQMKKLLHENLHSKDTFFANRLQAFRNIIARSEFSHKKLQIDARYGFRFVADNEDNTILSTDKLSSGEQHILIMTFELLFLAPDDSLVLIDEPEMSFHVLWQVDYLSNLQEITDLRNLQCIICTHSPQIFNMNWDLTVDLYTQSKV